MLMNTRSSITPQVAFWGLCLIAVVWIVITAGFEIHQGWPVTGAQWMKRLVGWGVELLLVRALVHGVRRCSARVGNAAAAASQR